MAYTINKYAITRRNEECACPVCGFGLFIEDHAYEIRHNGVALDAGCCSRTCAEPEMRVWEQAIETSEEVALALTCGIHGYGGCPDCAGETA